MYTRIGILFASLATIFLSGCFNLASPSSQIAGSYVSEQKYDSYNCDTLTTELNSLSRREAQLVLAQDQRRGSSLAQAFFIGVGNGDGIEASELASVRGEKEAVQRSIDFRCPKAPQ